MPRRRGACAALLRPSERSEDKLPRTPGLLVLGIAITYPIFGCGVDSSSGASAQHDSSNGAGAQPSEAGPWFATQLAFAYASWKPSDSCPAGEVAMAEEGTVEIDGISSTELTGSFFLTFGDVERYGSGFQATVCDLPDAASNPGPSGPVCMP